MKRRYRLLAAVLPVGVAAAGLGAPALAGNATIKAILAGHSSAIAGVASGAKSTKSATSAAEPRLGSDITWFPISHGAPQGAAPAQKSGALRAAYDKFFGTQACTAVAGKPGNAAGTGISYTLDQTGNAPKSPQLDIVAVGFSTDGTNLNTFVKVVDLRPLQKVNDANIDYVNGQLPAGSLPHLPNPGVDSPDNPGTSEQWLVSFGDKFVGARYPVSVVPPMQVTTTVPALPSFTPPAQVPQLPNPAPASPQIPTVPATAEHNVSTAWYAPFFYGSLYDAFTVTTGTSPSVNPSKNFAVDGAASDGNLDFGTSIVSVKVPLATVGLHLGSVLKAPRAETRQYLYDSPARGNYYPVASAGPGADFRLGTHC